MTRCATTHKHSDDHDHNHKHNSCNHHHEEQTSHRHEHGEQSDHNHEHDHCCAGSPIANLPKLSASRMVNDGIETDIRIMQMDCPTEESLIRKKLGNMTEVKTLKFNLIQRILTVTHTPTGLEAILDAIRTLGFDPQIAAPGDSSSIIENQKQPWLLLIAALTMAVCSEVASWTEMPQWLVLLLALFAITSCGLTTYKKGWIALRNGNLNINALMSIAVTGALIIGQWPEAAMVMVLFTLSELIEAKSLDRARNAINSLMKLSPDTAVVKQNDGSWQEVEIKTITLGNLVRIKPGERIGLDGEIIRGHTTINQAPITGESLPVDKTVGDIVFAGTINESGSFEYRVTATANDTTLARIIHVVEEAQNAKASTQRFVDQFARIYTPTVFFIALAIAIIPPLFTVASWYEWIYKALVILVIACPCALVISTPITIVSGLTTAARRGVLIKGGIYLELGRKIKWLALDKTGTITHGKPVQTDMEIYGDNDQEAIQSIAVSLAAYSDHPVSQAITAASPHIHQYTVDAFEALIGLGIKGNIQNKPYWLGNLRLINEITQCPQPIHDKVQALEKDGKTVVILSDGHHILGLFAVSDTVKNTSREAIKKLHTLGVKTIMLTGDNTHTANAIAQQVGIDEAYGNQLPDDKLNAIKKYSQQGITGMVGDGINDAPAIALSNIGFAMGAMGTDTAIETADVALMDDDLRKIPEFIILSKQTYAILVQNITVALCIKAIFLGLTLAGLGTMWMAVFADVGASMLVITNSLRLLRK
ncbi:heavy metal translocating P-type ATPase [Commensalibacter oyaizuii]|uniref:P-type Zn(2+) transporter n=1 Tax=Commensalibacter oyaizuii TaxID=3043873 RepID=A0ABT6Q0X3_9PROT|nr:heavy metal translocating P-type ATPase [Commensalibacter sp. TBRC 16381]MDI2090751.1 heavy metal translocating P-type ATPase [Commensalibacter sp. TBRC 16381]